MMETRKTIFAQHENQHGYVLILSMVMLIILSLIGIFALNTTDIELRISGNERQEKQIFYGTESGCRRGGQWLRNLQLSVVDDYVDTDLFSTYLAKQDFSSAMKIRDITKNEEANLGDAHYPVKYEYDIAESESTPGTRLDCQPIPGNNPGILNCFYDVACDTATISGGARVIAIRVHKPTDFN